MVIQAGMTFKLTIEVVDVPVTDRPDVAVVFSGVNIATANGSKMFPGVNVPCVCSGLFTRRS